MKRFLSKRTLLIVLAILFFLMAWNREISLLYVMFALLTSTLILSHYLPHHALKDVMVERYLDPTAFEGDEIDIEVSLYNSGWGSRYMIEVVDSIDAAEPGLQHPMTFVARLKGRRKRNYSFRAICYKRGEYVIGPLTLRSAYPLGISSVRRPVPDACSTLLVYPEIFEIARLPLRARGYMPVLGVEAVSKAGGSEEFFGIRGYKPGDSLRYIHWPSTAKHSRLIVKEFEIRASAEVTLLMDLHRDSDAGMGKETTLEYAVKVAASIAKYALARGHTLQLTGYGEKPCIVPYSKGLGQLTRILEALARVKCEGDILYPRAISLAAELLRDGGTVILLFTRWNGNIEEYLYSLSLLKVKRMRLICVFIDRESFLHPTGTSWPETHPLVQEFVSGGSPVYFISKGDDLRKVFAE